MPERLGSCTQCGLCCTQLSMPWTPQSSYDDSTWMVRSVLPARMVDVPDAQLFLSYRPGVTVELDNGQFSVSAPMDELRVQVIAGTPWAIVPIRCSQLGDNNLCQVYGSPARPQACSQWPVAPWQLETLPQRGAECGYSFSPDKESLSLLTTT